MTDTIVVKPMKITVLFNNKVYGPMDLLREFLGPGCELCLALACSEALEAISQRKGGLPRRRKLYFMSTPSLCTFAADSLGLLEVEGVCTLAAKHGLLPALKILLGKGCEWHANACRGAAAQGGHLEMLKWLGLPDKGQYHWNGSTCQRAAKGGHLDVLQWLREGQCDWDANTCNAAARGGHLEMLQWLRLPGKPEGQCDWNANTCYAAAQGGHLDVLKWLRLPGKPEGQCEWNHLTCTAAARGGHLNVLKWLRLQDKPEGQCDWDAWTCRGAAEGGHLAVLKWLRLPDKPEGQCDWDLSTCDAAAEGGHLEVLQWLRLPDKPEGQCDWDASTCAGAAEVGHLDVLKWLRSGEDPCPWSLSMCKEMAMTSETVVWIESQAKAGVESDCDNEYGFYSDDDDSDEVG
jgi:hypothetical protein